MSKNCNILILASVMLILGGLIYVLFREEVIFTSWITALLPVELPNYGVYIDKDSVWGYLLLFILADALWYGSLLLFDLLLRSNTLYSRVVTLLTMSFPFVFELLQLCHIMPGTFDWIDIIVYLLTLITFLLCQRNFYCKY